MKPVRVVRASGDPFDAADGERVCGVPPRKALTGSAARSNHGADPFVERGRHKRLLSIARMAGDADLVLVHFRKRIEIIDGAHPGPRPSRNASEIVVGIGLDELVGIVRQAVMRIGGVVKAGDVASTHGRVNPAVVARLIGQEHREKARGRRGCKAEGAG